MLMVMMRVRIRRRFFVQGKVQRGDAVPEHIRQARHADRAGQDRRNIGEYLFAAIRKGVEHGGDEHVARNAAQGLKVKVYAAHRRDYLAPRMMAMWSRTPASRL